MSQRGDLESTANADVPRCVLTLRLPDGIPIAMTLDARSIVVASKDQLASEIGGETVILGLTAGRYYGVDAVGARVWQLLQQPIAVADLRDRIVTEYAVDPERCLADLLQLLRQMAGAGLVEVRGDAAP
jgi:hypothetical protein